MKSNRIFLLTILVASIAHAKKEDRIEYAATRVLTSLTTLDGATGDIPTSRAQKSKKQTRKAKPRVGVKKS